MLCEGRTSFVTDIKNLTVSTSDLSIYAMIYADIIFIVNGTSGTDTAKYDLVVKNIHNILNHINGYKYGLKCCNEINYLLVINFINYLKKKKNL